MAKRNQRRPKKLARPITTKRDYDGASAVARRLSGQKRRDSSAEQRLQSLLHELEKYDDAEEDQTADLPEDEDYAGPRRRWSDESSSDG